MNIHKACSAVQMAAKNLGISEAKFVSEVEAMIQAVYGDAEQNGNQQILAQWRKIPSVGKTPTAYELVSYLTEQLCRRMN